MSWLDDAGEVTTVAPDSVVPPGNERRADLRPVIAALSAALSSPQADSTLPAIFEQEVQQQLSLRAVRLREIPSRYHARLVTPTRTAESIVLGVPSADARVQAILEASFERGRLLDDKDVDLLTAAAQLGGLVLQAVRTRGGPRPAGADGAGSLIGSTSVMAWCSAAKARYDCAAPSHVAPSASLSARATSLNVRRNDAMSKVGALAALPASTLSCSASVRASAATLARLGYGFCISLRSDSNDTLSAESKDSARGNNAVYQVLQGNAPGTPL